MAYDLQEQEQIDSMKAFWAKWGKLISAVVVGSLTAYLGYKGWHYYQAIERAKAAELFSQFEQQVEGGAVAKAKSSAALIQDAHPGTPYAANAALLTAKLAFEKGDLATARGQLKWVIEHAGKNENLLAVARLRLATIMLDEKQYDAALAELAQARPASFDGLYFDLRGDVQVARGDAAGARESYKTAISKLSSDSPVRELVQTKLESLGN